MSILLYSQESWAVVQNHNHLSSALLAKHLWRVWMSIFDYVHTFCCGVSAAKQEIQVARSDLKEGDCLQSFWLVNGRYPPSCPMSSLNDVAEGQDLSRTYQAHHDLQSVFILNTLIAFGPQEQMCLTHQAMFRWLSTCLLQGGCLGRGFCRN